MKYSLQEGNRGSLTYTCKGRTQKVRFRNKNSQTVVDTVYSRVGAVPDSEHSTNPAL